MEELTAQRRVRNLLVFLTQRFAELVLHDQVLQAATLTSRRRHGDIHIFTNIGYLTRVAGQGPHNDHHLGRRQRNMHYIEILSTVPTTSVQKANTALWSSGLHKLVTEKHVDKSLTRYPSDHPYIEID